MNEENSIELAAAELRQAQERYDTVHKAAEAKRREETDALNALNRAQAAFDATVKKMREGAPWNSDWHSRNRRGETVPV